MPQPLPPASSCHLDGSGSAPAVVRIEVCTNRPATAITGLADGASTVGFTAIQSPFGGEVTITGYVYPASNISAGAPPFKYRISVNGVGLNDVFTVSRQQLPFGGVPFALPDVTQKVDPGGITAAEFERAKTRLIADAVYAADNQATMARWYGAALTSGGSVETVTSWPARLRAVTLEAVQNAARTWLARPRSVTGYLVKELPGNQEKRS